MILCDVSSLAKALPITHTLHGSSADGNEAAVFPPLAPHTLATGSQLPGKVNYPSSVSICFLPLFPSPVPVSISLTLSIPIYLTLGHVTFLVQIITHHSFLKATTFLYYTSVLISTKIIPIISPKTCTQPPTERSLEIEGLRLSAGAKHKLKPSPSFQLELWKAPVPFRSTSYVPVPYWVSMWVSS